MQGNIVAAARWICAGMVCSTLILVGGLVLATVGTSWISGPSGAEPTPQSAACVPAPGTIIPQVMPGVTPVQPAPSAIVRY